MKTKLELPQRVLETLSEEHMFALRGGNMLMAVENNGKNCSAINGANNCDTVNNKKNCSAINQNQNCMTVNNKGNCTIIEPGKPIPGNPEPQTPNK